MQEQEYLNRPFTEGLRFFCSWSGGKDSCLALYRAIQAGAVPGFLLTLFTMKTARTETHALDEALVRAQSESLNIPLRTYEIAGNHYERYEKKLQKEIFDMAKMGVEGGVFGDTQYNLEKANRMCRKAGMTAWLPLWHVDPVEAYNEFIDLGFKAVIVCCSNSMLGKEALGQTLTKDLLMRITKKGIDPLGEENEYHTFVYDGPIFSKAVPFVPSFPKRIGDYWVNELTLG